MRPDELARNTEKLLNSVSVKAGALSLSPIGKERPSSKEFKLTVTKRLNTGLEYECNFFDILEDDSRKILVEAHSKEPSSKALKPLTLTYAEIADILEIEPSAVLNYLEDLSELFIVEDATDLQLARMQPQGGDDDMPLITISLTNTMNILEPEPTEPKTSTQDFSHQVKFKLVKGLSPSEAATRIQRHFRAKLSKDRVALLKSKAAREDQQKLALRTAFKDDCGNSYILSIYSGKLSYEARAENGEKQLTCKIDKVEVVDAKMKSDHDIVPMLKIVGNQLIFVGRSATSAISKPIISALKGNSESRPKQIKARKLLTLCTKEFDDVIYMIAIYEVETGLLVECFKPEVLADSRIVSLHLSTQSLMEMYDQEYPIDEINDTIKLIKGQLVLQPIKSPIKFVSKQNLLELTQAKPDYKKDYEAMYRQRIISRGTKMFRSKLYVVVMSIEKADPDIDSVFNDSDKLTFEVLSSSSVDVKQTIGIDLKTASEITGLGKDMVLAIGNIIINRMLDVRDGRVVIDPSSGPINCEQSASKIKAHLRGFVVRKNLQMTVERMRTDLEGRLILLKVIELNERMYGVSVRLFDDEVKIEAANFDDSLKLCVGTDIFNKFKDTTPEKVASDYILPALKIEYLGGTRKLTIDPAIRQTIETQAKMKGDAATAKAELEKTSLQTEARYEVGGAKVSFGKTEAKPQVSPIRKQSPSIAKKPLKVFPIAEGNRINPDSKPSLTNPTQFSSKDTNHGRYRPAEIFDEFDAVLPTREPVESPPPDRQARQSPVEVITKKIESATLPKSVPRAPMYHPVTAMPTSSFGHDSIEDVSPHSSVSSNKSRSAHTRLNKPLQSSREFQRSDESYRGFIDGYTFAEPRLSSRQSIGDNFNMIANPAFIHSSALNRRPPSDKSSNSRQISQRSDQMRASFESSDVDMKPLASSHDVFFSPVTSAPLTESSELLLRTGHKIDRVSFIVSIFRQNEHIKVEAVSQRRGLHLTLNVVGSFPTSQSAQELESICSSILTRLALYRNRQGEVCLNLTPDELEEASSVLYKKFQYISNRYFIVTVKETPRGVVISAYEPEKKKAIECNLGKRHIADQHQIQEELDRIVERLKVRKVLGDDVLIIAP